MENKKCPKCGGEFEEGYVFDRSATGFQKPKWATDTQHFHVSSLKNEHEVKTNRCKKCGYLESYAK